MISPTDYLAQVLVIEERLKASLKFLIPASVNIQALVQDPYGVMIALIDIISLRIRGDYLRVDQLGIDFAKSQNNDKAVAATLGLATDQGRGFFEQQARLVVGKVVLDLNALVLQMRQAGMSDQAMLNTLDQQLRTQGPAFSPLINGIAQAAASGVQYTAQVAMSNATLATPGQPNEMDEAWGWVTVEDEKVCPDCRPRHGQIKSLRQWRQEGLPKSGFSVCGDRDRCFIVTADYMVNEVDLDQPVHFNAAERRAIGERAASFGGTRK